MQVFGAVLVCAALLVLAWPGWLQPAPYQPRGWAVESDESLVRLARELGRRHADQQSRPGHIALTFSPEVAHAALNQGAQVYLYCIDDAVKGLADAELQAVKAGGANVFACAYGAERRHIPLTEQATFAGLGVVTGFD